MFIRLKLLYKKGKLTEELLEVAVSKSWITEEEKQEIIDSVEV
jgi:hypothetical protein